MRKSKLGFHFPGNFRGETSKNYLSLATTGQSLFFFGNRTFQELCLACQALGLMGKFHPLFVSRSSGRGGRHSRPFPALSSHHSHQWPLLRLLTPIFFFGCKKNRKWREKHMKNTMPNNMMWSKFQKHHTVKDDDYHILNDTRFQFPLNQHWTGDFPFPYKWNWTETTITQEAHLPDEPFSPWQPTLFAIPGSH